VQGQKKAIDRALLHHTQDSLKGQSHEIDQADFKIRADCKPLIVFKNFTMRLSFDI
jgi:hypothetical protein